MSRISSLRSVVVTLFLILIVVAVDHSQAFADGGTWTTKASSPTKRRVPAVAAVNGILYAAGGAPEGSTSSVTTVEAYDPATNTWTTKASMPVATQQAAAATINGILYVAGGGTCCGALTTLQAYNPATNSWSVMASMGTARYTPAAGMVNGKLYVAGGGSGFGAIYNTLEEYAPADDKWSVKAPMPTARAQLAIGVVNGVLYAVGGADLNGPLATVEAYDPAADMWRTTTSDGVTPLAPMPTPRGTLGLSVIDGILYAVGGTDATGPVSTVEAYDPATNTWSTMASLPVPRG